MFFLILLIKQKRRIHLEKFLFLLIKRRERAS
jgi:hypothetical protein